MAIFPWGRMTTHFIPARAAYAAADAEVLPVLAQITTLAPRSFALDTATVIPRSLKEQLGFIASSFRKSSKLAPIACAKLGTRRRGVLPSFNVTMGVAS